MYALRVDGSVDGLVDLFYFSVPPFFSSGEEVGRSHGLN